MLHHKTFGSSFYSAFIVHYIEDLNFVLCLYESVIILEWSPSSFTTQPFG